MVLYTVVLCLQLYIVNVVYWMYFVLCCVLDVLCLMLLALRLYSVYIQYLYFNKFLTDNNCTSIFIMYS